MAVAGVAGIVQRAVEIGGAVIKGGEQEAQRGRRNDRVGCDIAETVVPDKVGQRGLCHADRADGAEDVAEYLAGVLRASAVLVVGEHVIAVVAEQDHVVALQRQRTDYLFVKGVDGGVITEGAFAQSHEQTVLRTGLHLRSRKGDVHQIGSDFSGQRLPEQCQHLFCLAFGHQSQRLVKFGDDGSFFVDIASPDAGDAALFRPVTAADFGYFFIVQCFCSLRAVPGKI